MLQRGVIMKTTLKWKHGLTFEASNQSGGTVIMDVLPPLGKNEGPTPKELVAMGLGGCTAMDVASLLKKNKQNVQRFEVSIDISTSAANQHPVVFTAADISFQLTGDIDPAVLRDAVERSQSLYCGVSAMLEKAFPIRYEIVLNGKNIGSGHSNFKQTNKT